MAKLTDDSDLILKHLKGKDPLDKAYFIYGEDGYVIEQVIKAVEVKRFGGGEIDPLSWEQYSANDTPFQVVKDSLSTVSMFGGPKVIIYRDIDKLKDSERKSLVSFLGLQPRRTHILLTASRTEFPATKDIQKNPWRYLLDSTHSACCPPLPDYKAAAWIQAHAKDYKLNFTRDAAEMAAACTGGNRAMIARTLEKLQIAITDGHPISLQEVSNLVVDTRQRSVFELTKALSQRRLDDAYTSLNALLYQGQEPIFINGAIARQIRVLLQVKIDLQKRVPDDEIMKAYHIPSFFYSEYKMGANQYSLEELRNFHEQICIADKSLKTSRIDKAMILSKLLLCLIPNTPTNYR